METVSSFSLEILPDFFLILLFSGPAKNRIFLANVKLELIMWEQGFIYFIQIPVSVCGCFTLR